MYGSCYPHDVSLYPKAARGEEVGVGGGDGGGGAGRGGGGGMLGGEGEGDAGLGGRVRMERGGTCGECKLSKVCMY